jgi:hypothetical protein
VLELLAAGGSGTTEIAPIEELEDIQNHQRLLREAFARIGADNPGIPIGSGSSALWSSACLCCRRSRPPRWTLPGESL